MSAIVSWLLPLALAALGNAIDAWAQNAAHVGGWVSTVAAVWLALRLHPNGINGPAKSDRTLSVDAPANQPFRDDHPFNDPDRAE